MRTSLAAWSSVLLVTVAPFAQNRPPDLSGGWQLVEPTAAQLALETLPITAPLEILITQTPRVLVVEHTVGPGTHPEAGTFHQGERGTVGGLPGRGISVAETWIVSHVGTQLMIGWSKTERADDGSRRVTNARGSMWRLEPPDRLVIEFSEERSGERPKTATRTYVKRILR